MIRKIWKDIFGLSIESGAPMVSEEQDVKDFLKCGRSKPKRQLSTK